MTTHVKPHRSDPGWDAYNVAGRPVMTIGRDGTTEVSDHPDQELKLCSFINQLQDEVSPTDYKLSDRPVEEIYSKTAERRGNSSRRRLCC